MKKKTFNVKRPTFNWKKWSGELPNFPSLNVKRWTLNVCCCFFVTTAFAVTPTPTATPAILTAASPIKPHWEPVPAIYHPLNYELLELVGTVYKHLQTKPTPVFDDVKPIGAVKRTFYARAIFATGPGLMSEPLVWPGAGPAAGKFYLPLEVGK